MLLLLAIIVVMLVVVTVTSLNIFGEETGYTDNFVEVNSTSKPIELPI